MKWLKRTGIAAGILVLVLAVVPFFISVSDYIPEIEKAASERLKEPVRIDKLSLALLPTPHLTVNGITVGKSQDLTVGKVTATPALSSLFGTPKVIRSLEIDNLVLTQAGLAKIPQWMKPDKPDEPAAVVIDTIKLDDATLKLAKTTFGPFDARLAMVDGGLESASLVGRDGRLKAFVKPEGKDKYVIDAAATGWTVPIGPPVLFDELIVKGVATPRNASFDDVRAKLFSGTVAGKVALEWGKGLQLKGNLDVRQIDVRPLLQALGRPASVSGRLTARPVFSARAASVDQIPAVLRLETPFEVHGGVLHGMDIGKAATVLVSGGAKGGETRFDRLSGHLVLDRGTRRLTKLNIASGSLSADGNVTVSPRDELSGRINAKVSAASVASATVPLNVSGTVQSPMLFPTGGSVAGAALGTAVAGPLGTAVGSKLGQWTEGLFGGGDSAKKK